MMSPDVFTRDNDFLQAREKVTQIQGDKIDIYGYLDISE